jgi:hypothetical protein
VVTAKTQYNLQNAKEYFEEHLCVGEYYDEGQRVAGQATASVLTDSPHSLHEIRAINVIMLCDYVVVCFPQLLVRCRGQ